MPYSVRVSVSSLIMMLCFISVAYGRATWVQLFGVTCAALQEGVGEASFLALASLYDTPRALSAWSSGTGFAGIFGYGWVYFLTFVFGLSNRSTLVVACLLAVAWMFTFFVLLTAPRDPTAGPSGDGGGNGCDTGGDINNEYSMIDDDDGDAHEGVSASSLHGSVRRHVRVPRGGRAHHNLRRVVGCGDNNTTSNSTTTGATAILTLSSHSYPSSSRARFVDGVKGYAPLPSRQSSPRPPPHVSPPPGGRETGTSGIEGGKNSARGAAASVGRFDGRTLSPRSLENASVGAAVAGSGLGEAEKALEDVATLEDDGNVSTSLPVAVAEGGGDDKRMTPGERLRFTLGLWRYMLPLSLVFFAEVCMCSRVCF